MPKIMICLTFKNMQGTAAWFANDKNWSLSSMPQFWDRSFQLMSMYDISSFRRVNLIHQTTSVLLPAAPRHIHTAFTPKRTQLRLLSLPSRAADSANMQIGLQKHEPAELIRAYGIRQIDAGNPEELRFRISCMQACRIPVVMKITSFETAATNFPSP